MLSFGHVSVVPWRFPYLVRLDGAREEGIGRYDRGLVYRIEILRSSDAGSPLNWRPDARPELLVAMPPLDSFRSYAR
ncbi:MAG TPA: hypothetical protein VLK35_02170 [Methylomirabilota bacterium]|nr:hypothetical protein [Methylomirabilota bacterium]